jgi:hypothetical protein
MSDLYVNATIDEARDIVVRASGTGDVSVHAVDCYLYLSIDPKVAKELARRLNEVADELLGGERND